RRRSRTGDRRRLPTDRPPPSSHRSLHPHSLEHPGRARRDARAGGRPRAPAAPATPLLRCRRAGGPGAPRGGARPGRGPLAAHGAPAGQHRRSDHYLTAILTPVRLPSSDREGLGSARFWRGPSMDDWIEEALTLQAEVSAEKASRVLDQHMIREPIRILQPRTPLSLPPSATVGDAVRIMREHRVGCVLVVTGERLLGIITERDLLLKLEQGDLTRPVSELMTPDPEVLGPEDPIVYA